MADPRKDPLYAGECECGEPIMRKTLAGVPPKRCAECRRTLGWVGGKRGPRAAEHDHRGRGEHDGPLIQIRRLVRGAVERPESGAPAAAVVAEGLATLTGMGRDFAESIVVTIEVLLAAGESEREIRERLNPNPARFGKRPAGSWRDEDGGLNVDNWVRGGH